MSREGGVESGNRNREGELVKLVDEFTALIMAQRDMEAKALYEEADSGEKIAILNAVPGYVTLLKRRYGLRED